LLHKDIEQLDCKVLNGATCPVCIPAGLSGRTSYVIGRNDRIRFVHSNMDYRDQLRLTLAAVRARKRRR
jgi:hypothetical protein